jgi:hypothetical protein
VIILRWIARAWSLVSVGVVLFFLSKGRVGTAPITSKSWAVFALFPLGVALGLLVAWWKESWGGAIAVACLLAFDWISGNFLSGALPHSEAFLLFLAPGMLFLVCGILAGQGQN